MIKPLKSFQRMTPKDAMGLGFDVEAKNFPFLSFA